MKIKYLFALALFALPSFGQRFEFGLFGGSSMYSKGTVKSGSAEIRAGFDPGIAAGLTLGQNMYSRLGGEVRYTYMRNQMQLSGAGQSADFGGESHAVHYDLVLHTSSFGSAVRPYVSFGGGVKQFRGTGTERAFQPLSQFAVLTRTSDLKPLISFGGGVKVAVSQRVLFRFDVRDYYTQVPSKVITPIPGSSFGGWIHNLVPTAGFVFTF